MTCVVCGTRTYKTKQPMLSHCTTADLAALGGFMKTLTPADTRIFDDDVLEDMQTRWDDDIPCGARKCDAAATVRVSARCCGRSMFMCGRHLVKMIALTQRDLSAPKGADCKSCGMFFPSGTRFDAAFRVVTL